MHTRLFSIAAPATRTRGGSGAEAALVSPAMAVKIAYLARSSGPAALQAPVHTAQASASAYEVDRGDRPGRHQRWTRTRAVTSVTGSRRTTMLALPPCSRSGPKTALQAAHRPPAVAQFGNRAQQPKDL
jgi:hypothetical protein